MTVSSNVACDHIPGSGRNKGEKFASTTGEKAVIHLGRGFHMGLLKRCRLNLSMVE